MNSKSREELVEQYEDVAFALLMSEYAEQEGNRLLREFEEAKAKGEVLEIPAALDTKCRMMIRQAYEKQRRKERMNRILRTMGRTAAMLFVTLGVCTTLVFSVEALRTPVINFLIEQHERFTSIDFDQEVTGDPVQDVDSTHIGEGGDESPLDGLVPEEFELSRYTVRDDGSILILYKNLMGGSIRFTTTVSQGNLNLDTEDANCESVEVSGYSGIFIEKDGELRVSWFDGEKNLAYQLRAVGLSVADFWSLAEQVANFSVGG